MEMKNNCGKAYAFLNCKARRESVDAELQRIKNALRLPPLFEAILTTPEKMDGNGDTKISGMAKDAAKRKVPYAIEAACEGQSSKEVAAELAKLFNALVAKLYEKDEQPSGIVLYERDGKYYSAP